MLRCAVPNASTRRVLTSGSAEKPADNKPNRNEEYTGENAARAEHCQYVADVRDRDQHDQQNKAQVGKPIEKRLGPRGDIWELGFYRKRTGKRKQHEQK